MVHSTPELTVTAIPGVPLIAPGDDLPGLLVGALDAGRQPPRDRDVFIVPSTLVSRAEGRFVDLSTVTPSARAEELARQCDKDPALVQVILDESVAVSRVVPGALIVRHRLGFVSANAAVDQSNAAPPEPAGGSGPWVLCVPENPDNSASAIRAAIADAFGVDVGVIVSDSLGRPFRLGSLGAAIGVAGLPPLTDQCGRVDLQGRALEATVTATADQIAAAADLVAGQADEGRGLIRVRGLDFRPRDASASELLRDPEKDLYA